MFFEEDKEATYLIDGMAATEHCLIIISEREYYNKNLLVHSFLNMCRNSNSLDLYFHSDIFLKQIIDIWTRLFKLEMIEIKHNSKILIEKYSDYYLESFKKVIKEI